MQAPTPQSLSGSQNSLGPQFGSYGYGLIHYTWAAACGVYGNTGDFPGYGTVAMATAGGTRGAALSVTSDTLTSAGQLGYIDVERLVACRSASAASATHIQLRDDTFASLPDKQPSQSLARLQLTTRRDGQEQQLGAPAD